MDDNAKRALAGAKAVGNIEVRGSMALWKWVLIALAVLALGIVVGARGCRGGAQAAAPIAAVGLYWRKKPIVIEAMRVPDADHPMEHGLLIGWFYAHGFRDFRVTDDLGYDITTLEGVMHANPDDWIIRGVQGEFYPCKPDVFAATYEQAEPPERGAP